MGAGAAGVLGSPGWFDLAMAAGDVAPLDPNYPLGVAAGDPRPHGAVIWTRVAPPTPTRLVAVAWEVAADPSFRVSCAVGGSTPRPRPTTR
jgi:alkaline phosphatase D